MSSILKYSGNVYSQNGEDFIIAEALRRINPELKVAVEFGAADGFFCSNTAALLKHGWFRQTFDINVKEECAITEKEITPENVNDITECSVLSIDIDGNDWMVWAAYNGSPDIVIIEINSSLDPNVDHFSKEFGANFSCMNNLAEAKDYFLLCHTGNNIYVLNKHKHLFPDADGNFNTSWL